MTVIDIMTECTNSYLGSWTDTSGCIEKQLCFEFLASHCLKREQIGKLKDIYENKYFQFDNFCFNE